MRLIVILLLFLIHQSLALMKMAKIFGKVESGPDPYSEAILSMTDCFDDCFDDSKCILAEFKETQCALHDYLSTRTPLKVIETEPGSLSFVAIKTTLPNDTCPVSFSMIPLTFIDPNGDSHAWKIDNNDGFEFSVCKNNWKRFDRSSGMSVCIKRVSLEPKANKEVAVSVCEGLRASIVGIETQEEVDWMASQSVDQSSSWLDGMKENVTNYAWSNELTTGSLSVTVYLSVTQTFGPQGTTENPNKAKCITVHGTKRIFRVDCTSYECPGVMCGYKLM